MPDLQHRSRTLKTFLGCLFGLLLLVCGAGAVHAESGYQVIDGTRVFTEIDHARGVATFSNSCGSQTLTQRQLQGGAKPTNIIPCSRSGSSGGSGGSGGGGSSCKAGWGKCPGASGCAPLGSVCCGTGYCDAGQICLKDEKSCLKQSSNRICPDKTICKSGSMCMKDNTCLSLTSPRYCGAGKYCGEGSECVDEDKCRRVSSSSPSAPSGSGGARKAPPISDACLVVDPPRVITSLGSCKRKDGSKSHWHYTLVHSSNAPGCPKSIEFDYLDPDEGGVPSYFTPFDVQICGGEPQAVEVKK